MAVRENQNETDTLVNELKVLKHFTALVNTVQGGQTRSGSSHTYVNSVKVVLFAVRRTLIWVLKKDLIDFVFNYCISFLIKTDGSKPNLNDEIWHYCMLPICYFFLT